MFDPGWATSDVPVNFTEPLLSIVEGHSLKPIWPHLRSDARNVAICVSEYDDLIKKYIANAGRYWDLLVCGSRWVEQSIHAAGWTHTVVITHGAPERFKPAIAAEARDGRFVIFSGGKLEVRKGQDIVIQAVGHMMQRYRDVHFVYDWHNPWPQYVETIRSTRLFAQHQGLSLHSVMRKCGVDFARCRTLECVGATAEDHQQEKLQAMQSADVGIFPSRAEGSGNSLMLEMMACAKPVVALYAHSQAEVLGDDALACKSYEGLQINDGVNSAAHWFEPNADEFIAKLEWAYEHRDELPAIGEANRIRVGQWNIDVMAKQYIEACEG